MIAAAPVLTDAGRTIELAGRELHVWAVRLDAKAPAGARFAALLSADERARAARFARARDREAFVVGRAALRTLLGRYLGIAPAGVRFVYGGAGKPALAPPASIRFNLAHSGDLVLLAFTRGCDVGIDVEAIRPVRDMPELAARFFCAEEAHELGALATRDRAGAFYRCWSRKEAYVKATGGGLSVPLDTFRVSLRAAEPARLVHVGGDTDAAAAWTVHDLAPATGYAAALAYRDAPRRVTLVPPLAADHLAQLGTLQPQRFITGG